MSAPENPTEAEVRALRDKVFGQPSTDNNWDASREYWLRTSSPRRGEGENFCNGRWSAASLHASGRHVAGGQIKENR